MNGLWDYAQELGFLLPPLGGGQIIRLTVCHSMSSR